MTNVTNTDCPVLIRPEDVVNEPNVRNILLDTTNRTHGTVVHVNCTSDRYRLEGPSVLKCLGGKMWDNMTMPRCVAVQYPFIFSEQKTIFVSVLGGAAGFFLIALLILIICGYKHTKRMKKRNRLDSYENPSFDFVNNHMQPPSPYRHGDGSSEFNSEYLSKMRQDNNENNKYVEEQRIQGHNDRNITVPEYEMLPRVSPAWSTKSLEAVDNYDWDTFGRLPRVRTASTTQLTT